MSGRASTTDSADNMVAVGSLLYKAKDCQKAGLGSTLQPTSKSIPMADSGGFAWLGVSGIMCTWPSLSPSRSP
jgi:hypothetical protein